MPSPKVQEFAAEQPEPFKEEDVATVVKPKVKPPSRAS
jgi:hypothetical protein